MRDLANLLIIVAILFFARGGDQPSPGPPPVPDVEPAPFPSDGLSVLIVEETEQRGQLPSSQLSVLTSVILREKVKQIGGEILVLDQNADIQFLADKWKEAMRKPRDSLPWILIANGESGHSGPLPKTLEETIKLVE